MQIVLRSFQDCYICWEPPTIESFICVLDMRDSHLEIWPMFSWPGDHPATVQQPHKRTIVEFYCCCYCSEAARLWKNTGSPVVNNCNTQSAPCISSIKQLKNKYIAMGGVELSLVIISYMTDLWGENLHRQDKVSSLYPLVV